LDSLQPGKRLSQPRLVPIANPELWANLLDDDAGQDLIEYALVAALISLSAVTAMRGLGTKISTAFSTIATNFTSSY